jgi:hypothetical protein
LKLSLESGFLTSQGTKRPCGRWFYSLRNNGFPSQPDRSHYGSGRKMEKGFHRTPALTDRDQMCSTAIPVSSAEIAVITEPAIPVTHDICISSGYWIYLAKNEKKTAVIVPLPRAISGYRIVSRGPVSREIPGMAGGAGHRDAVRELRPVPWARTPLAGPGPGGVLGSAAGLGRSYTTLSPAAHPAIIPLSGDWYSWTTSDTRMR